MAFSNQQMNRILPSSEVTTREPNGQRPAASSPLPTLAEGLVELRSLVVQFLSSVHRKNDSLLHRFEVCVQPVEPLLWLCAQRPATGLYWADRQKNIKVAGVGVADIVRCHETVHFKNIFERLRRYHSASDTKVAYYGGFRFDSERKPDEIWNAFGECTFVLPRFELVQRQNQTILACTLVGHSETACEDEAAAAIEELQHLTAEIASASMGLPEIQLNAVTPDRAEWKAMMDAALELFGNNTLQKIVLARKASFTALNKTSSIPPFALFQRLAERNPEAYHFFFHWNGQTFLGCTPERLYARTGRRIETEAVAGTRQRGVNADEDKRLAQELFDSDKDRREHSIVYTSIIQTLMQLCETLEAPSEPSVLKLMRIFHLRTSVRGVLRGLYDDADILTQLHPTPALAGFPQKQSVEHIRALEPFDRGWYGAPVGRVGYDEAEFAVAIRSALLNDSSALHVFAGAGLVPGSEAEDEWQEIEYKMNNLRSVFPQ